LFFQQASNLNGTSGLFTETAKAALTENLRAQAPDTSRGETEDFPCLNPPDSSFRVSLHPLSPQV
jgi:hypothetical protein